MKIASDRSLRTSSLILATNFLPTSYEGAQREADRDDTSPIYLVSGKSSNSGRRQVFISASAQPKNQ